MGMQTAQGTQSTAETNVFALYRDLLDAWNKRNAHDYAVLFTDDANVIGFDGSQMDGRVQIETELSRIFKDHVTSAYVGKVREVRLLAPNVALLRAVVGMVPPGKSEINPATNAIQSLVATKQNDNWRIVLFQNTPAQFHGRPELAEALTAELQELV